MLAEAIRRYFLGSYAAELARPDKRGHHDAFSEATFQTVLLVIQPMVSIGGLLICLLLHTRLAGVLIAYRSSVVVAAVVTTLIAAYLLVRRLTRPYRDAPQAAAAFGSKRDRWITNLQFNLILPGSLALPFATALVVRLLD